MYVSTQQLLYVVIQIEGKYNKVITMMRRKSPSSEHIIYRKNQVEQIFGLKGRFGKGDNFCC